MRSKRYKALELASQYPKEQLYMASKIEPAKSNSNSYIATTTALALMIDSELTRYQYESIKYVLQGEGYDILPPYAKVLEEKKKCYPDNVEITESEASVSLQSLLDHTTTRLIQSLLQAMLNTTNVYQTIKPTKIFY